MSTNEPSSCWPMAWPEIEDRNPKTRNNWEFSKRAESCLPGAGEDDRARWRRRFAVCHCARSAARATMREAEAAARAVANSSLVKTSWHGGDPNWGRVLCAIGYSKARVDEAMVDVGYSQTEQPRNYFWFSTRASRPVSLRKLAKITAAPEFDMHVDLHSGRGEFVMYASDLTEEYVEFNKGDVSDPKSLGG